MAFAPLLACVPSPQYHAYDAIWPSESEDPEPSTLQVRSVQLGAAMAAVGTPVGAGPVTVTVLVTVVA